MTDFNVSYRDLRQYQSAHQSSTLTERSLLARLHQARERPRARYTSLFDLIAHAARAGAQPCDPVACGEFVEFMDTPTRAMGQFSEFSDTATCDMAGLQNLQKLLHATDPELFKLAV